MTDPSEFAAIPDHEMFAPDTWHLRNTLTRNGWQMTLQQLDDERRRRDGRAPYRFNDRKQG